MMLLQQLLLPFLTLLMVVTTASTSFGTSNSRRISLQDDDDCSSNTTDETNFSGMLTIDIEGSGDGWVVDEDHADDAKNNNNETSLLLLILETAIQVAYGTCMDDNNGGGYYEIWNVAVNLPPQLSSQQQQRRMQDDVVSYNSSSNGGNSSDDSVLSLPYYNFTISVYLEGRTNLTTIIDANGALFADDDEDDDYEDEEVIFQPLRGQNDGTGDVVSDSMTSSCGCSFPNKSDFIRNLSNYLQTPNSTTAASAVVMNWTILDVHETVSIDCASNTTQFTSGLAVETVGDVTLVDGVCLQSLSDSVVSLYNSLNILNEDTCDLQFREITDAIAFIDEGSIPSYYDDDEQTQTPSAAPSDTIIPSFWEQQPSASVIPSSAADTIFPTSSEPTEQGGDGEQQDGDGEQQDGEDVVRRYSYRRSKHRFLQTTQQPSSTFQPSSFPSVSATSTPAPTSTVDDPQTGEPINPTTNPSSSVPSVSPSLRSTPSSPEPTNPGSLTSQPTTSLHPSSLPSTGPPSMIPTFSEAPSSSTFPTGGPPTTLPTQLATTSPTVRGANLNAFSILLQLEGHCRGCESESNLFDQTSTGDARRMTLDQNLSILPFGGTALKMVGGGGHRRNREMLLPSKDSSCYCSPDAEEGVPTVTEFLTEFQQNVLDGNEALAQCIGSVTSIEEIRIFDCNDDDKEEFETYLKAEFTGDLSMLTEEEVLKLEETTLVVFQDLEDMVCDTTQRSVMSVRTVARGPVDKEDVTALSGGSSSSSPVAPPALRRRELDEDDTNQPSPSTTENPTSTPTAAPSLRPTTSTQLPTFYPTIPDVQTPTAAPSLRLTTSTQQPTFYPTIPDVQTPTPTASPTILHTGFSTFYLMLELTGDCRGCSTDTGSLFNQVIPERRRRQRKLQLPEQLRSANKEPLPWRLSGSRKLEGHTGKCGCGLESPDGGVTIQEFESNFAMQVEMLALPNVISLNGVMELTSISPIPTPAPTMPQPTSSETPTADSELSSSFTPTQITSLPTFSPAPTGDSDTSSPTFSPTSIPTNARTPDPTALPTPSPTSAPSTPAPTSKSPSSSPTLLPTTPPTPTPSAEPTPEPTKGPTPGPTPEPSSGGGVGDCIAINRGDSSATNGIVEASFETVYAIIDFSGTGLQPLSEYTLEQFNGFEKYATENEYIVVLEKGWVTMENPGFMVIRSPHNEGDPELVTFSDPTCVGVNSI